MAGIKQQNTYKVILPYNESANPRKAFKIEYTIDAPNRETALAKAEREFFAYTLYNSASWVRVIDRSGVRVWRMMQDLPQTAQTIDELAARLEESDEDVIYNTLRALGDLEDASAGNQVIPILSHPNSDLAALAVETLGRFGDPGNISILREIYTDRAHPRIKACILSSLGRLTRPGDDFSDILASALGDEDPRVRANAVEVVEQLRLPTSTRILVPLLEDEDNRVRANVLRALWESHDRSKLMTVLKDMTLSESRWMRASAAFVLQHLEVDGRLELLGSLARDEFPEVHGHARKAILSMSDLDCLPFWLELAQTEDDLQRIGGRIAEHGFAAIEILLAYHPKNREEKRRIRLLLDCIEERIFRDEGWISWLKTKQLRLFSG